MSKLREQFLCFDNLDTAWKKVATNKGCAGVDGETIAHFSKHKNTYLKQLQNSLIKGTYYPFPLRQILIPKTKGGWRELRVPTVRDRIAQQALLQILHPIVDRGFEESSFAYRPQRSHLTAVRRVAQWRDRGYDWVLDGDIVQYFDNILHQRLFDELKESIDLPWVSSLIECWVSAGVLTKEGILLPQKGIPQGAVISPLLANVYLDDFDESFNDSDVKLVRYADDFLLLSRSQERISKVQGEVTDILDEIGLTLHPTKTQITNFEQRMNDRVSHPDVGSQVSYRRAIELQIQRYKRCLLESVPYEVFIRTV